MMEHRSGGPGRHPHRGTATIGAQTEFNLSMGVYTGSDVSNLATVGVFEWAWNVAGAVSFFALEGSNYNFAVNGDYGAGGGITLNLRNRPPIQITTISPIAQLCSALRGRPPILMFVPRAKQASRYTEDRQRHVPSSGRGLRRNSDVSLFATGSGFVPRLSVYTGTDLTNLTSQVEGTNGTARFHAVTGTVYQLALDGTSVALGNVVLELGTRSGQ